jgi:hypothetical protein
MPVQVKNEKDGKWDEGNVDGEPGEPAIPGNYGKKQECSGK